MTINSNSVSFEGAFDTPLIQDPSQTKQTNVHRYKMTRLRGNSVKQLCSKSLAAVNRHKEAIKKALVITGIALAILAAIVTSCVLAPWTLVIVIPSILAIGTIALSIINGGFGENYDFTSSNKPVMIWGEEEKNWWE